MLVDTNGYRIESPEGEPSLLRPFSEIMAGLVQPLPQDCLSSYQKQGQTIYYVHHAVLMMMLDHYAGVGCWHAPILEVYEVCGNLLVKLALTIRAQEGEFTQYALGWDEGIEDDSFGGPIPKAYATAFRRAAMLFGVERRLWDPKQKPMAKLAAHWAKGQALTQKLQAAGQGQYSPSTPDTSMQQPITLTPAVCRVTAPKKLEQVSDADRAQQWHDLHTLVMDACRALEFVPGRVQDWFRKDYGKGRKTFSTREMSNEQLAHALGRLENREGSPALNARQVAFLRTPIDPPGSPADDAARASVEEVDPETGELLAAAPGATGGSV